MHELSESKKPLLTTVDRLFDVSYLLILNLRNVLNGNDKEEKIRCSLALAEMPNVSRTPTNTESSTLNELFNVLDLTMDTTVRVLDAESFINGLYLSSDRKSYYLSLINGENNDDNIDKIVLEFQNARNIKYSSSSNYIKEYIEAWIRFGSQRSLIYRNLIVAFLAKTEACPFVTSILTDVFNYQHFKNVDSSLMITYKENQFCFSDELLTFYFDSNFKIEGFSFFSPGMCCEISNSLNFAHEIGHSLDFVSRGGWWETLNSTLESVAEFLDVDTCHDLSEIWQIMGIKLVKNPLTRENILYINKLSSDFALMLDMSLPIITTYNSFSKAKNFPSELVPAVYDALMKVYGSSLQEYVNKLRNQGRTFDTDIQRQLMDYDLRQLLSLNPAK